MKPRPGDSNAKGGQYDAPLLGDPEKPLPTLAESRFENFWKKSRLTFYTCFLLFASIGNTVYFKRMTSAMPNYAWYLTQLSTCIYIPVFACLSCSNLHGHASKELLQRFMVMGVFDSLSGVLMVLGGTRTSGTSQVLLSQAVIPITMLFSVIFIGKRYHALQKMGAAVIVLGILLANAKGGGRGHSASDSGRLADDPIFNAIFLLAVLPGALSSVFKEVAFRSQRHDLDVNVLQFWVALFQGMTNFIAVPVYSLRILGSQRVTLTEMPQLSIDGTKCLFFGENHVVVDCGEPGLRPCDSCESAWIPVCIYLLFNVLFNIATMMVIKHGSAALSFLVATLRMPLSSVAFSSALIMGSQAVPLGLGDLLGLVVIISGLVAYRWGSSRLKDDADPGEAPQSPASPASPASASSRGSVGSPWSSPGGWGLQRRSGRAARFSWAPIFTAGMPTMQPVFVHVRSTGAKTARSADRVRSDLYQRLGAASPLQSPNMRYRSPGSSSGAEECDGHDAVDKMEALHLDSQGHPGEAGYQVTDPSFDLVGLPPQRTD